MRLVTCTFAALLLAPAPRQERPKPEKEHAWLQPLAGEWTTETSFPGEDGKEPTRTKGSATGRMIGDFWAVMETRGEAGGVAFTGVMTIGYDPEKKNYVGTWIDSMNARLWHYLGTVDGSTLALMAEGPNHAQPDKQAKYRDALEVKAKDHLVLTSSMEVDGKWTPYLAVEFKRKAK